MRISDWSSDVCSSDLFCSLLHDIGKQADVACALDGLGQFTLLLCGDRSDTAGDDLAALGYETLQQSDVLVIDLRRILGGEGAALTAAEKWECHGDVSPYSRSEVRRVGKECVSTCRSRWAS